MSRVDEGRGVGKGGTQVTELFSSRLALLLTTMGMAVGTCLAQWGWRYSSSGG